MAKPDSVTRAVLSIQNAADMLRASLDAGEDTAWFDAAFGFCDHSLSRLRSSTANEAGPVSNRPAHGVAPNRPSLNAARTISSTLIGLADRMRTEVFQVAESSPTRDEAADFIGKVYLDVLKPLYSAYPEIRPKELER